MLKAINGILRHKFQLMKALFGIFCIGTILYWSIPCYTIYFEYKNKATELNSTTLTEKFFEISTQDFYQNFINLESEPYTLLRKPYVSDSDCKNLSIRLYEIGTFNLTALVSYPGSGNTWLRHLIEIATGIYTGSVYFDEELFSRGFLGERQQWNSGTTIVQKIHLNFDGKLDFPKAILIIREPFPSIVSFVNYLEAGHVGSASPTTFRKREWPFYILNQVHQWITLAKSWIESGNEILIIHYEKLKENPSKQLKRICEFLHIFCQATDSSCFHKHVEGSFHRGKNFRSLPKPKPPYPKWVRDKVDDEIDYLNNLLHVHKHENIPLKLYEYYRKP